MRNSDDARPQMAALFLHLALLSSHFPGRLQYSLMFSICIRVCLSFDGFYVSPQNNLSENVDIKILSAGKNTICPSLSFQYPKFPRCSTWCPWLLCTYMIFLKYFRASFGDLIFFESRNYYLLILLICILSIVHRKWFMKY